MDFSTPWAPSLNGDDLPELPTLREVEDDALVPDPRYDKDWTKRSVDAVLVNVHEGRAAILESVLTL